MRALTPVQMMFLAGALVVVGFLLPLLMVMRVLQPSFLLSFIAYAASFGGLMLGIIGSALWARIKYKSRKDRDL